MNQRQANELGKKLSEEADRNKNGNFVDHESEYLAKLRQGVEVPFSIGPFTLPPEFIQHIETGQTALAEADMLFRFFQKAKMHIVAEQAKIGNAAFSEGLEKGQRIGFEKGQQVRARFLSRKAKMHIVAEQSNIARKAFREGFDKGTRDGFERGKKFRANFLLWIGTGAGFLLGLLVHL